MLRSNTAGDVRFPWSSFRVDSCARLQRLQPSYYRDRMPPDPQVATRNAKTIFWARVPGSDSTCASRLSYRLGVARNAVDIQSDICRLQVTIDVTNVDPRHTT